MTLDSSVDNEHVTIYWSRIPWPGGRSSTSSAMRQSDSSYTGSLIISPLAVQDDGTYTCIWRVTGGTNVLSATGSAVYNIPTISKSLLQ